MAQSPTVERVFGDPAATAELVEDAVAWCSQHGLVYGAGLADLPAALVPAPVSLLPVAYPRATFQLACAAATAFNALADAVAHDDAYLAAALAPAAAHDPFTARLLAVHTATANARAARAAAGADIALAVNRSDYMLHAPTASLLQVELNTIASSFGCLSTLVSRLHRHLMERSGASAAELAALPECGAMDGIADALGAGAAAHGASGGVVVMVVQPGERNAFDQQWLQLRLWQRHGVRTLRRSLREVADRAALDDATGALTIDGHRVAVVYFRAGYTPDDYPTDAEWAARETIERSDVAACPSVALQLAGAKKVQQDLARPGVVERFACPEDATLMRRFFAGLWALDGSGGDDAAAAIADAIAHPEGYVLKPQREGGGNNVYGEALAAKLRAGGQLGDLILMQRILPPPQHSVMVRLGAGAVATTLSELGVYGTYLRRGGEVLLNAQAGHLVRTKAEASDEGGVAAGFAVLDSPYLAD